MAKNIALCGAHGTGKSTLVDALSKMYELYPIQNTVRSYWEDIGVEHFERLPEDVRTVTQKEILLRQIAREDDEGEYGFITDRSVLDVLAYTIISSNMHGTDWKLFEQLVKERLQYYAFIIYVPVEFAAKPETGRADIDLQDSIARTIVEYLERWNITYLRVSGRVKDRIGQIEEFLK